MIGFFYIKYLTMEAKELRLGNYVLLNNTFEPFLQITSIHKESTGYFSDGQSGFEPPSDFLPIPLTEDWLVKFGFNKFQGVFVRTTKIFQVLIGVTGTGKYYFSFNNKYVYYLDSVQKLQNLYFALTGSELTIQ